MNTLIKYTNQIIRPFFQSLSHRYGRVQSVKILLQTACNPNLLLSIGSLSGQYKDQHNLNDGSDDSTIFSAQTGGRNCNSSSVDSSSATTTNCNSNSITNQSASTANINNNGKKIIFSTSSFLLLDGILIC